MSNLTHHVYVPIDAISSLEPSSNVRNIKTIGFVRDDYICALSFDSAGKVTVGTHKIKVNFEYIGSKRFLHYCPYVIYAVMDWVDSAPLLTPKHMQEMTADVYKYHVACLEVARLFPAALETMVFK